MADTIAALRAIGEAATPGPWTAGMVFAVWNTANARAIVTDRNLSSLALDVIEAAWEYEYGNEEPDMQSADLRAALDAFLAAATEAVRDE